mmetsp:Transcript_8162/g.27030  ORF Transcript_8162/g.27030 Transcript_8162/m.27030 type:complete len:234 (+) Transcript_8162:5076-5777(+)
MTNASFPVSHLLMQLPPDRNNNRTFTRRQISVVGGGLYFAGSMNASASTAGRVPGLSAPDDNGERLYKRPVEKSGGHGVGWSEITPYTFVTYTGWEEKPVSIADPEGTEIDAKFVSEAEGELKVLLAPILRFADFPDGSNPQIQDILSPASFIQGFAPELIGDPVQPEDVLNMYSDTRGGLVFYNYELKSHWIISATVYQRRVYIIALHGTALQWKRNFDRMKRTALSFCILI